MDITTELLAYDLRRHHDRPDRDSAARSEITAARRDQRRHRWARQLRSVADRLDG